MNAIVLSWEVTSASLVSNLCHGGFWVNLTYFHGAGRSPKGVKKEARKASARLLESLHQIDDCYPDECYKLKLVDLSCRSCSGLFRLSHESQLVLQYSKSVLIKITTEGTSLYWIIHSVFHCSVLGRTRVTQKTWHLHQSKCVAFDRW